MLLFFGDRSPCSEDRVGVYESRYHSFINSIAAKAGKILPN